jgi:predicted TIM-barrel fold metal-dependent hydrolase
MPQKVHDIHPHIISRDDNRYPRAPLGGEQSDWSRERPVTAEDMIAAMDEAGVASSALVQAATCYGYDNSYVADAIARYPDRFTAVGTIDVLAPDAVETMKRWMAKGIAGLRLYTGGSKLEFDVSWLDDPRSFPVWEYAGERGISICIQTRPIGIPVTIELAKRFPKTKIVLDHLARSDIADGPPYNAAAPLFSLAPYKNVYLKVTPRSFDLAATGKASPETFFARLVEEFGAKRIAFGSNYPASSGSLKEIVDRAKDNLKSLKKDDRDWILGGTAETLYPKLAEPVGALQ